MMGAKTMALTPGIKAGPEVIGTGRCTIYEYHTFDRFFGDAPCTNCKRDFCHTHAAKEPESNWTTGLCSECGAAYCADGSAGLRRVRERLFRVYGS